MQAVRLGYRSSLEIVNCEFVGSSAAGLGGVVRAGPLATVSGRNNLFANARAILGGGVFAFASRASLR